MTKTFRNFNRRRYKFQYACCNKRATERQADKLRKMGYYTRVVPTMSGKKMRLNRNKAYILYKSLKRKWED